jgi:hypothetical protein
MLQVEEDMKYLQHFYRHEPREALILDKLANITIKNKPIAAWTLTNKK